MTAAQPNAKPSTRRGRRSSARYSTSAPALGTAGLAYERVRLSCRLRRVLTDNPHASHFTVQHIVKALGTDNTAPSLAVFAAAGMLGTPGAGAISGAVTSSLGVGMVLGQRSVHLPRSLLRRKIPRTSLALLIHGIATLLEKADGVFRERWTWVCNPLMSGALGLILFLLGLASMTPVIGGGVQHAASAFFIALGIAEHDGLTTMLAALAGIACLALAVLSVASGRKLWAKVKAWLLQCARALRLDALSRLLNHCCDGLGELIKLRWSGLLLMVISPVAEIPSRSRATGLAASALRRRARLIRSIAHSA